MAGEKLRLSRHAARRLRERGINMEDLLETVANPDMMLLDTREGTVIYVSGRRRLVVVASPGSEDELYIVTVIPVRKTESLVERRIRSGRWLLLWSRGAAGEKTG